MKDVEIGTLGETRVYMHLDELVRIANKELQEHADAIELHNSRLLYLLDEATKALKFYANKEHWNPNYTDAFSYKNGWEIAQDCLKEIEERVSS